MAVTVQTPISQIEAYDNGFFTAVSNSPYAKGEGGTDCTYEIIGLDTKEIIFPQDEYVAEWGDATGDCRYGNASGYIHFTIPNNVLRSYVSIYNTDTQFYSDESHTLFCGPVTDFINVTFRYVTTDDPDNVRTKQFSTLEHYGEITRLRYYDYTFNKRTEKITTTRPGTLGFNTFGVVSSRTTHIGALIKYINEQSFNNGTIVFNGIRHYKDKAVGDEWLLTGIDPDPGHDDPDPDEPNPSTGDPYELETINNETPLSRTLILSKYNMQQVAEILYPDSIDDLFDLIEGLSLNGENPSSFIVDCFWVPIDPHEYCVYTPVSSGITNFGSKPYPIGAYDLVKSTKHKTVVNNVYIPNTYNDFRSLMCSNMYISLPYAGIYHLEPEKYLGRTLKIDCYFDVRTGSIKYYLYSNGLIQDMYNGSVRMSMPITSSDMYQSSREKMSALSTIGTSIAGLNPTKAGIVSGIASLATGVADLKKESPKHISGGFSSEMNLIDSRGIYLITETRKTIYPDTIKLQYGLPDNQVTTIGSFTDGSYVVATDVVIGGNKRQTLKDRAAALIAQGIYI